MGKKLVGIAVLAIMLLGLLGLSGCAKKASEFTEEEHIQRVTERVEKKFMKDESKYTGFTVYPLYTENDELRYFLLEFEPYGFLYVLIRDEGSKIRSFFGASTGMYKLSTSYPQADWSPYTIDETNSQPLPYRDRHFEVDENGEQIVYKKSPYSVAGIVDERRYLLEQGVAYVAAVKREGKYVNLISLEEVEMIDGRFTTAQAYAFYEWGLPKQEFDL